MSPQGQGVGFSQRRNRSPSPDVLGYVPSMKILVTGGAGFIGSHVADACLAAGHEVWVLDDLSTGSRDNVPEQARFVHGDIRNRDLAEKIIADFLPDAISHQAAQTSVAVSTREPVRDAEINIVGTLHILNAAVKHGVKHVVFASTGGAIYGEVPDGQCASLDWAPRPLSPYACSKFAIEGYLVAYQHAHELRSTVLRYANVYGPRQDPHGEAGVVAIFSQRLLAGEAIQVNARKSEGDDGCVRDYVYVDDVVRANMMALSNQLGSSMINVCTGVGTSTRQLAGVMKELCGSRSDIRSAPRREGDVERSVLDVGADAPLGELVSLQAGLEKTVDWFRAR